MVEHWLAKSMLAVLTTTALPRVVLIGDSIRDGYQRVVVGRLEGRAEVVGFGSSTTRSLLEKLDAWIVARDPAVVHINCGLHDCAIEPGGELRVPIEEYQDLP